MPRIREHERFKVVDLKQLKGSIIGVQAPLRLSTFGGGGCGFYSLDSVPTLTTKKRVHCLFSMLQVLSVPVTVQGNVAYSREIKSGGKVAHFYGIQFIKPHRHLIIPIVNELTLMNGKGEVELAEDPRTSSLKKM